MSSSDLFQPLVTATAHSSQKAAPAPETFSGSKELLEEEQTHKLLPRHSGLDGTISTSLQNPRPSSRPLCSLPLFCCPFSPSPPSTSVPGGSHSWSKPQTLPRSPSSPLPHSWVAFPPSADSTENLFQAALARGYFSACFGSPATLGHKGTPILEVGRCPVPMPFSFASSMQKSPQLQK